MKRAMVYVAMEVVLVDDPKGSGKVPTAEEIQRTIEQEYDSGSLEVEGWLYSTEILATSTSAAEAERSAKAVLKARKS